MVLLRTFFLCICLSFAAAGAFAQDENCELTLTQATEEFQAGHFYSIPAILSRCLGKFTTEQSLRANMLLTQTYLLLDDPLGAKRSYLEVLKANPEFVTDPNIHSIDIVYLSQKFTTRPIFSWLARAGTNIAPVRVIFDNDIFGQQSANERYAVKLGYQAAVGGDLNLYERLSVRAELQYQFLSYMHRTSRYFEEDRKLFDDRMTWLNAPLAIMYGQEKGKYRPFGYAGYSFGYLLRDMATVTIENVRNAEVGIDEKQSPDINMIKKRNRWNQCLIFGGGVNMKFGLQFLFVDLRYTVGLKNIVNGSNLYTDSGLDPSSEDFVSSGSTSFSYAHVDDYFRLDNLAFTVGYLHPLYKPRERKRIRTRSKLQAP